MLMSEIAGQSIVGLAEQFGTPCYVYDAELIRKRIADLKAFPTIRFAQKACSNISILKLMREQGVVVDAVSAGEIKRALLAGYAAKDIVYTADVFDHAALKLVAELKLPVNCGSIDMIGQLAAMNTHQAVTLRINPDSGMDTVRRQTPVDHNRNTVSGMKNLNSLVPRQRKQA